MKLTNLTVVCSVFLFFVLVVLVGLLILVLEAVRLELGIVIILIFAHVFFVKLHLVAYTSALFSSFQLSLFRHQTALQRVLRGLGPLRSQLSVFVTSHSDLLLLDFIL